MPLFPGTAPPTVLKPVVGISDLFCTKPSVASKAIHWVLQPGWRLTLAPGGHSVTYSSGIDVHELDLLAPFSLQGHGAARLRHWLHLP